MKSITVELADRSYPIVFCPGLITGTTGAGQDVLAVAAGESVFVVSNETVAGLYLEPLKKHFGDRMLGAYIMPDGEEVFKHGPEKELVSDFWKLAGMIHLGKPIKV